MGISATSHIVKTKTGHFEPKKFEDHYEEALRELLNKKQKGEKITAPKEHAPAKVVNLMDALRRSVEGAGERRRPAASSRARRSTAKRASHSTSRRRKAS
jgi:DNA end-binding protein Ku